MKAIYIIHFFSLVILSLLFSSVGNHIQSDYVWTFKDVVRMAWFLLLPVYGAYFWGRVDERNDSPYG